MPSEGLKVMNFQLRTEPFGYSIFQIFRQVVKDELPVLQQRAAVLITAETRISYDTL